MEKINAKLLVKFLQILKLDLSKFYANKTSKQTLSPDTGLQFLQVIPKIKKKVYIDFWDTL